MHVASTHRPSPALIVALIALVAALAGTASALPGKGSVDKNDLDKGAVTKKAIKKKAVTTKALATGAVTAPKIAAAEAPHVVGAAGEPPFGNGGEGDCVWRNANADEGVSGANPAAFYRDQLGFVRTEGLVIAEDGPGGDTVCDLSDPGEIEDGIVFTLPDGHAPSGLFLGGVAPPLLMIAPPGGGTLEGFSVPGGAVLADGVAVLDGLTFRTATAATADAPARVDLDALRALTR